MSRLSRRRVLVKACVLFAGTCVALLVGEVALRVVLPLPQEYYVRPPHMRRVFRPLSTIMPGVEGESRYITNSEGIRGDELTPEVDYRVLAVGGSTTECLYLDQDEAWPHLLQMKLNESGRGRKVWVGNVGKSGLNTRDHIVQLRYLLNQFHDINAVILLVGVNDLTSRLKQDAGYDPNFLQRPDAEQQLLRRNFSIISDRSLPFYKKTAGYRLLRDAKTALFPPRYAWGETQDEAGKIYLTWRERRQNAPVIRRTPPDLNSALEEYARNINTLIELARSRSVRLILVTQPFMWRRDIPSRLNGLLWMGGVGDFQKEDGKEYYSVEVLADAMELYNETLLRTCRERGAECVDLSPVVPKDINAFYDDVHLNESGAAIVAEALAKYLIRDRPL
jgi:lysophospholipase L1-like esterase